MASGPITSWQIDGETVETVSDFIFGCIFMTVPSTRKLVDQGKRKTSFSSRPKMITLLPSIML